MPRDLPETQYAVQLVGPDELRLNTAKPVPRPGAHQLVARVEAVGLCFSDLKLVKQFTAHPRKSEVTSGLDAAVLAEVSSYVPGELPTVPGHEAVVRVAAVGEGMTRFRPGERYLVQTDYRWLRTAAANAAFGYNIEGALQEYVLLDERVITSPEGESMLIPVPETFSASAIALVEPWACVEDAYASVQRQTLKAGGRMLVVAEAELPQQTLKSLFARHGQPAQVMHATRAALADLAEGGFDDVLYAGTSAETVEALFPKLAPNGLLVIALCGGRLERAAAAPVGAVHYRNLRIAGTAGSDPAEAMATIPASGEIRAGNRIHVIGAGGPMGVMHVVRCLCRGVKDISLCAADLDEGRLAALRSLAGPLCEASKLSFRAYNPSREAVEGEFDYLTIMVPAPALVAQAVTQAAPGAIINIFAGIPVHVTAEVDLNAYITKGLYFVGTSGSVVADMRAVLDMLASGSLDTNLSVAAVSGMAGAISGIREIEANRIPGKVIVYPSCHDLGLVRLSELGAALPEVEAQVRDGVWNREAERALLERGS
jgi:threonine dehydrogenase-like Zn-dependent dehydrogenase